LRIPLRLVLAFFAAYGLNIVLHESAHALMAHFLGLPATLFHFYVNISYPVGDSRAGILCAIAGPLFNLICGTLFWILYQKFQEHPVALLLLYSSIQGTSMFLGNLFSTSLVAGDFGIAARYLNLSATIRVGMTLAGALLFATFLYRVGPELLRWTTPQPNPLKASTQAIVWPVTLGTLLVIIAFLPMPSRFIVDWIAASLFWVFAAVGVILASKRGLAGGARDLPVPAPELIAAVVVLVLVRFLAQGIHL
jgi:hypothetical protein